MSGFCLVGVFTRLCFTGVLAGLCCIGASLTGLSILSTSADVVVVFLLADVLTGLLGTLSAKEAVSVSCVRRTFFVGGEADCSESNHS